MSAGTLWRLGYIRIDKRTWYRAGGFSEPRCVRTSVGKSWAYWWRVGS